jgi:hypothetical protein
MTDCSVCGIRCDEVSDLVMDESTNELNEVFGLLAKPDTAYWVVCADCQVDYESISLARFETMEIRYVD